MGMGRKIEAMNPEVIESPLSGEELAVRYRALCDDPHYANVPGRSSSTSGAAW
jgi:hypothetical protein